MTRTKKWYTGLCILNGMLKGIPSLVRPETKKLLDIKDLEESIQKCKRLTNEDRVWWSSFVTNEKTFRENWASASAEKLSSAKRSEWQLDKFRKHHLVKAASSSNPDQQQQEETLADLLRKADHFPNMSHL